MRNTRSNSTKAKEEKMATATEEMLFRNVISKSLLNLW